MVEVDSDETTGRRRGHEHKSSGKLLAMKKFDELDRREELQIPLRAHCGALAAHLGIVYTYYG